MRRARPDIALSSDFIVGFPGESDADFDETLALVREVGFASSYAFKYSARPGTPAAELADQIDEATKAERLAELFALLEEQRLAFNRAPGRTPARRRVRQAGSPPWSNHRPLALYAVGVRRGRLVADRRHGERRNRRGRPEFADRPACRASVTRNESRSLDSEGDRQFESPRPDVAENSRPRFRPSRRTAGEPKSTEIALAFDDNGLASIVFGHYDQNIARIERRLGVTANANGNQIVIRGPREASEQARRVFELLYERAKLGQPADEGDVEGVIEETSYQGTLFPGEFDPTGDGFGQIKTRRRGVVRARNAAQDRYLAALRKHELVFAEGPAGTGKTWLAVGHAVSLLEQGIVERLVLSRPAVEAGERLGFLPGDMRDKVDPYLRPIYDALYDFMEGRMVERGIQTGMIEIAPLAFMRGRTLSKAAILLDEAQNATAMQMKMFLTRLGEGSRMMVNGDPSQTDLAPGQKSGLSDAIALLGRLERVGHVRFRHGDVVRHDLVRQIVEAYESAKPARPDG